MECAEARTLLLGRRRGQLEAATSAAVDEHLAGCARCRAEDQADRGLSDLLAAQLRPIEAPASLVRKVTARVEGRRPPMRATVRAALALSAVAAAALLIGLAWSGRGRPGPMVAEAVNDHLRVLYREHPLEVESSDSHTVKPWFTGRLDFAPVVAFEGDEAFPLLGGSVGYFIDRKAAVYHFRRRLHAITLVVFPAEGLPWPTAGLRQVGHARASVSTTRGFHTVLLRAGDLGYALVSDVNERELLDLAGRIVPAS